jgi:hypothetical protein
MHANPIIINLPMALRSNRVPIADNGSAYDTRHPAIRFRGDRTNGCIAAVRTQPHVEFTLLDTGIAEYEHAAIQADRQVFREPNFSGLGNTPPLGNRRRLVEQGVEGVMTFADRRLLDQARFPLLSSSSFPLGPLELRSSRKTVV